MKGHAWNRLRVGQMVWQSVEAPMKQLALLLLGFAAASALAQTDVPRLVVQTGHIGVNTAVFSPDGRYVLTASQDQTACLWDAETGKEVRRLEGHTGGVSSAVFSRDSKRVLTASGDKTARLWDAETGKEVRRFEGHTSWVYSAVFSPDGRYVLTASEDKTARLWDAETGKELRRFEGHTDLVNSAVFSPDSKYVLTASYDNTACLWDAETGKELRRFQGHTDLVQSAVFSPDGKYVLTASTDKTARLWDTETGKELRRFEGHKDRVKSAVFSPNGKHVLTASHDRTARLWDSETGKELRRFEGHTDMVNSAVFSRDGRHVLTASWDNTARLWDAETAKELRQFEGHASQVNSAVFSSDGRYMLAAGDKTARLWDIRTGKEVRRFEGHTDRVHSAIFSPDGKHVLTASYDNTARLWDAETGKEVRRFEGHASQVESAVFSPDGRRVLTASYDKTARLWDVESGKEVRRFVGHTLWVFSAVFSPDGRHVLTASGDRTARLWDAKTGKEVRRFEGPASQVTSAVFSRDGSRVLTASFDGDNIARLWDAETGKVVRRFDGHTDAIYSAVFSPDGRHVLTASRDKTARLWDVETGKEVRRFEGHTNGVSSAVFSPNGRQVLTASYDKTARLWDAASGKELCKSVSFTDGTWAVVDLEGRYDGSNNGRVDGLHWVIGMEPVELDQLRRYYFLPGLLSKISKHEKLPPVPCKNCDLKLYPAVTVQLTDGNSNARISLTNQGGGIGKVHIFVNGTMMEADARGPRVNPDANDALLNIDLTSYRSHFYNDQENVIEVKVENKEGYLVSRGVKAVAPPSNPMESAPTELYAIVVGTCDYASPSLRLRFSGKDAADYAQALLIGAKRPFGVERTHLSLLTDCAPDAKQRASFQQFHVTAQPPTRNSIRQAFESARKAKPGDVLLVYLAGHGVTYKKGPLDIYAYLTMEATGSDLSIPAVREATAITDEDLWEWVKEVPANKRAIILDTCGAGAAVDITAPRDRPTELIRALAELQNSTGFHVLLGCSKDRSSYEASRFNQGLLTYSLLQGMKSGAALRGDRVSVGALFAYAQSEVPKIAGEIHCVQQPQVFEEKGQDFPIGVLAEEDRSSIRLTLPRPALVKPDFQLTGRPGDPQRLTEKMEAVLWERTTRGSDSPIAYWETTTAPGTYRLAGRYQVSGKHITIKAFLDKYPFDGSHEVGSFTVEGPIARVDGLILELYVRAAKRLTGK